MAKYTLFQGDCYEYLKTISAVDAIVTDPPYGINANKMTLGSGKKQFQRGDEWDIERPDMKPFLSVCKFVCVWGGNYFTDVLPPTNRWLIWHKKNDGLSFSEAGMAWTNYSKNVRVYHRHWSGEQKEHPTQKPLHVMSWVLSQLPPEVKIVFDPFMGSGTTGVACMQMGIDFIGCEINPDYYAIAEKRISEAASQGVLLAETRLTQPAPDAGESAPLQADFFTPADSTSQASSTPTQRR
jgi:DNA modification methylase